MKISSSSIKVNLATSVSKRLRLLGYFISLQEQLSQPLLETQTLISGNSNLWQHKNRSLVIALLVPGHSTMPNSLSTCLTNTNQSNNKLLYQQLNLNQIVSSASHLHDSRMLTSYPPVDNLDSVLNTGKSHYKLLSWQWLPKHGRWIKLCTCIRYDILL